MRLEAGTKVGEWNLVSEVDPTLSVPLWVGDNGSVVTYVRPYRVRSLKVTERLEQLAKWAATFEHNCILPTRELHEVVGGTAVVSNYEEGQPLSAVMARARIARKPVPPAVATAIALDLLDGLHALGGSLAPAWAHGGLRPEAVLITRAGRARIMEVGISGEMAAVEPLASDNKWAAYAAPEQIEGRRLTEQTDIFTVASIAWELLVGKPLFEARNIAALKKQIVACDIQRADQAARTDVPKALAFVLEQALEADPDDRFQTTVALSNALRSAADDVAEQVDVSHYLEEVQRVALDARRRSLGHALGRAAPTSMPPPATTAKKVDIPHIAPAPRIPSFAITPKPKPAAPKPAAPKPVAPKPKAAPKKSAPPATGVDGEIQRLSAPLELMTPKPPMSVPPVDDPESDLDWDEEPIPSVPPTSSIGDDIPVDESLAGEPPPSSSSDIVIDESLAGEPPPSSAAGEDIPVDESLAGEAPPSSAGEDIPIDESLAGEPPPADEDEPGAPLPQQLRAVSAAAPEPVPPPEVSSPGPPIDAFADLQLDADRELYNLKPPRRWPWFVLGVLVGAAAAIAIVYRAPHLLPMPLPKGQPTATATPPDVPHAEPIPEPDPEPEPEPSAEPSAAPSAEPSAAPKPPPRRPTGRVRAPTPTVVIRVNPPAPRPAPKPAPDLYE